jgi:hypothetical protein
MRKSTPDDRLEVLVFRYHNDPPRHPGDQKLQAGFKAAPDPGELMRNYYE